MKTSIIIPVFNAEQYLRKAIDSILEQTERDYELLIINDGSTDGSLDIVKSYQDERIVLVNLENNLGKYSAGVINLGIKNVTGKYVTWVSADDFLTEKYSLEKLVAFLDNNPKIDMVSGNYRIVNIAGDLIKEVIYAEDFVTYQMMRQFNYICPSILIKKSSLDKVGFMNETLIGVADWDYWLRASLCCKIYKIEDVLYSWRSHGQNTAERNPVQYEKEIAWVRETYK